MKNLFKIIAVASLGLVTISCGTTDPYYGNRGNYPTNNGTVYRAPDGTVYRRGDVYRDRNGNVYQNGRIIRTGGNVYNGRNLPPGQAKKVYGGEAKDYAPGQMKKRNGYYNDKNWDKNHNNGKYHKKGKGNKR